MRTENRDPNPKTGLTYLVGFAVVLLLASCSSSPSDSTFQGTTAASASTSDTTGATTTNDEPASTTSAAPALPHYAVFVDGYDPPTIDLDLDTGVVTSATRWFDNPAPEVSPGDFSATLTGCEVLAPGVTIFRGELEAAADVSKVRLTFHTTRVLLNDTGPADATAGGGEGFDIEFDGSGTFAVLSDVRVPNWFPEGRPDFFPYELDLELTQIQECALSYRLRDGDGGVGDFVWSAIDAANVDYRRLMTAWDAPAGSVQALGINWPRIGAELSPWEWVAWTPLAIQFDEVWAPDPALAPRYLKFGIIDRAGCDRVVQEFEGATIIQSESGCPGLMARREATSDLIGGFVVYSDPDPEVTVVALELDDQIVVIEGTDRALVEDLALASSPYRNLVRLVVE